MLIAYWKKILILKGQEIYSERAGVGKMFANGHTEIVCSNHNRTDSIVHYRCGYTGHFYRGKLPFYHGKLYLVV